MHFRISVKHLCEVAIHAAKNVGGGPVYALIIEMKE